MPWYLPTYPTCLPPTPPPWPSVCPSSPSTPPSVAVLSATTPRNSGTPSFNPLPCPHPPPPPPSNPIHSRLFDHRPIIQADIRFFVKEFEEKRGFRERRGLENVNNLVLELSEKTLPKNCEAMSKTIPSVLARCTSLSCVLLSVDAANHILNRIQQREQEAQQVNAAGSRYPQQNQPPI
uniref:Biogenesis of lysosome-related organelles complex 1 subunit 5 n=1 Tax=Callorhinchus milii TaxID=7868 RepID=A0A4W3J3F1_CALMI